MICMENFKVIHCILSSLEKAMDLAQFDLRQINAKALGVSETRWARYLEMMADVGYIKGVRIQTGITGEMMVDAENIRITLKGLEYLQENTIMRKMYNAAKGLSDILPIP